MHYVMSDDRDMFERIHAPSMRRRMDEHGLTDVTLIKLLKRELKAKITKTIKVKGAVSGSSLPKGRRIVAESGVIYRGKDGDNYGDGDTVVEWDEVDWAIRQRARQDAHKLRGDYAPERMEHSGIDGGDISMRWVSAPPMAVSIDDWQQQVDAIRAKQQSGVDDNSEQSGGADDA